VLIGVVLARPFAVVGSVACERRLVGVQDLWLQPTRSVLYNFIILFLVETKVLSTKSGCLLYAFFGVSVAV